MDNLLFFVTGGLLMYLILQRPLQITVHHKNENIVNVPKDINMDDLEEKMLKEDPKKDKMYEDLENLDKVIEDVNDIMGGSDR
jgi:hypothetical protein